MGLNPTAATKFLYQNQIKVNSPEAGKYWDIGITKASHGYLPGHSGILNERCQLPFAACHITPIYPNIKYGGTSLQGISFDRPDFFDSLKFSYSQISLPAGSLGAKFQCNKEFVEKR